MTKYCRDIGENSSFLSQTSSSSQAVWIQLHRPIYEEDEDEVEEDRDSQDEVSFSLKGEPSKLQSKKEKFTFTETRNQDSLNHTPANVIIHHRPINEKDSSSSNQSDDEEEIIVVVVDHHQEEESRPIPTDEHDETGLSHMDVNQADKNKWPSIGLLSKVNSPSSLT